VNDDQQEEAMHDEAHHDHVPWKILLEVVSSIEYYVNQIKWHRDVDQTRLIFVGDKPFINFHIVTSHAKLLATLVDKTFWHRTAATE
jgi:hypothetical protein